jgi:type III secretion protein L
MGSLFFIKSDTVIPSPESKVIKAEDYAVIKEANEILDAARARAAEIEEDAKKAYEAEKIRGHEDGMLEGKMEMSMQMLENVSKSVDYLEGMENTVIDIVVRSLKAIIGEMDEKDLIFKQVKKALHHVRDQKRILLRVNAEQADFVQDKLSEMLRSYPGIGLIDISADSNLPKNGCVMETEMGVIDASLEMQLDTIEKSFRQNLEGSN